MGVVSLRWRQLSFRLSSLSKIVFRRKEALFLTILVFVSLIHGTASSAGYPCDVDGDGRLGLEEAIGFLREISGYPAEGPETVLDCGEPEYDIPGSGMLGADAKRYLLCKTNEIRSQVALGTVVDDGTDGFWPTATDMQRMRWDENLAAVAQQHADRCVYEHNDGRDGDYAALTGIGNPAVGENIAAYGISWTIGPSEAVHAIERALSGWNGEHDLWHYDTINNASWATGYGHFTQNVWAETTRIGCGQAWCPDGWPGGGYNMIFTVCNYYIAGNWWGEYPYRSGDEVCSEGMMPGDTCENGLIVPEGYGTGIAFPCDVDGDGEVGLGEVIDALRTLTGAAP
jgi:hypothetical protein